ncbi:hypothetical protein COCNU_10G008030 [Cocos nucifera]|uniref:Uncharacterized protein n=1 Tax=Cocos nucifera TaxID=13894 RepID=A0A8K0IMT8_COCNU|nr:hypothetical protein COCNU_10G008030 [Cocos nucifera]
MVVSPSARCRSRPCYSFYLLDQLPMHACATARIPPASVTGLVVVARMHAALPMHHHGSRRHHHPAMLPLEKKTNANPSRSSASCTRAPPDQPPMETRLRMPDHQNWQPNHRSWPPDAKIGAGLLESAADLGLAVNRWPPIERKKGGPADPLKKKFFCCSSAESFWIYSSCLLVKKALKPIVV